MLSTMQIGTHRSGEIYTCRTFDPVGKSAIRCFAVSIGEGVSQSSGGFVLFDFESLRIRVQVSS